MITPAAPVVQPAITSYDLRIATFDYQQKPAIVNIVYYGEIGATQVSPDQVLTMTLPQLEATPGANTRLKMMNAVSIAMGLVSPTIT